MNKNLAYIALNSGIVSKDHESTRIKHFNINPMISNFHLILKYDTSSLSDYGPDLETSAITEIYSAPMTLDMAGLLLENLKP